MSKAVGPGAVPCDIPGYRVRFRTGLLQGLLTTWKIARVTLPLYIAVDLLAKTPALPALGRFFAPVMALFGLPGESALAFLSAFLLNIYAAIAVIAPLKLTAFQVTQCGLMMGIAHNLVVEGAVLRTTGARGGILTLFRLLLMVVAGIGLNLVHKALA